ncbi:Centromere protein Scm3, N-terminal [Ceraceosorus bombacis]|uniref:Centromere protein Scm3, N-terminal n=1 Tax=Ceraceosorus bombacis TaxID=401625 RepID=A0A0P1BKR7_9BASI|nr:Centromere protein Scm3, N-terminal [Ceraceosorus bombacis]
MSLRPPGEGVSSPCWQQDGPSPSPAAPQQQTHWRFFPPPYRIDTPGPSYGYSPIPSRTEPSHARHLQFTSQLGPPAEFNPDGSENVEFARYASTLRLKSRWDDIFARFEDAHLVPQDEIHLGSGTRPPRLIRDRGTLKGIASKRIEFGAFIKDEELNYGEERSLEPWGEVDSDEDEIGIWGASAATAIFRSDYIKQEDQIGSYSDGRGHWPSGEHAGDPHLAEFLEAEAHRKAIMGDIDEDEQNAASGSDRGIDDGSDTSKNGVWEAQRGSSDGYDEDSGASSVEYESDYDDQRRRQPVRVPSAKVAPQQADSSSDELDVLSDDSDGYSDWDEVLYEKRANVERLLQPFDRRTKRFKLGEQGMGESLPYGDLPGLAELLDFCPSARPLAPNLRSRAICQQSTSLLAAPASTHSANLSAESETSAPPPDDEPERRRSSRARAKPCYNVRRVFADMWPEGHYKTRRSDEGYPASRHRGDQITRGDLGGELRRQSSTSTGMTLTHSTRRPSSSDDDETDAREAESLLQVKRSGGAKRRSHLGEQKANSQAYRSLSVRRPQQAEHQSASPHRVVDEASDLELEPWQAQIGIYATQSQVNGTELRTPNSSLDGTASAGQEHFFHRDSSSDVGRSRKKLRNQPPGPRHDALARQLSPRVIRKFAYSSPRPMRRREQMAESPKTARRAVRATSMTPSKMKRQSAPLEQISLDVDRYIKTIAFPAPTSTGCGAGGGHCTKALCLSCGGIGTTRDMQPAIGLES